MGALMTPCAVGWKRGAQQKQLGQSKSAPRSMSTRTINKHPAAQKRKSTQAHNRHTSARSTLNTPVPLRCTVGALHIVSCLPFRHIGNSSPPSQSPFPGRAGARNTDLRYNSQQDVLTTAKCWVNNQQHQETRLRGQRIERGVVALVNAQQYEHLTLHRLQLRRDSL